MTIRTVSDLFTHLGHEFRASCKSREPQPATVIYFTGHAVIPHGEEQVVPTTGIHFTGPVQSIEMARTPFQFAGGSSVTENAV
jgi:hypothetical protein